MSEGTNDTAQLATVEASATPPIPKVFASWTSGQWLPLAATDDTDEEKRAEDRKRKVAQSLGQALSADQSLTLFGLGPSAGIGGPKMSDLWRAVKDATGTVFTEMQAKVNDTTKPETTGDIEKFLSHCQHLARAPVDPDSDAQAFINTAEKVIARACSEFVNTEALGDHAHVLRLIARRSPDKGRPRIFTTNYDLCIEQAASRSGILLIDGFGRETPPAFDGGNYDVDFVRRRAEVRSPEYVGGVAHLIKLHGSVDWELENGQILRREKPESPVIIYPRSDKFELTYTQPFLEAISQLQTSLRHPNLGLIVAGFSFSDSHLSEMLFTAVRRNLGLHMVVATWGCEKHCDALHLSYREKVDDLRKLAERGDSRITLIDCDFATLARLMPDAGTETEEDRLRRTLRELLR
ncbi:SIR2 family protein [Pseudoxanthomonas sp. UTMC 1351]|uniref:SIR2 family protein n=1 Tax=Pseudoxanthomonas sp. UTMC 1351 TaxID=2695853 RepID=UPI0034CFF48B